MAWPLSALWISDACKEDVASWLLRHCVTDKLFNQWEHVINLAVCAVFEHGGLIIGFGELEEGMSYIYHLVVALCFCYHVIQNIDFRSACLLCPLSEPCCRLLFIVMSPGSAHISSFDSCFISNVLPGFLFTCSYFYVLCTTQPYAASYETSSRYNYYNHK